MAQQNRVLAYADASNVPTHDGRSQFELAPALRGERVVRLLAVFCPATFLSFNGAYGVFHNRMWSERWCAAVCMFVLSLAIALYVGRQLLWALRFFHQNILLLETPGAFLVRDAARWGPRPRILAEGGLVRDLR